MIDRMESVMESVVGGLDIRWDRQVLEPRPWTVEQAEWLAELSATAPAGAALELCSGVGHLGLVLHRLTARRLVMVDANPRACELAAENARAAGTEQVEIRNSVMTRALESQERFALVLADPPWVPRAEITRFPDDPTIAIDGGPTGLDLAVQCLDLIEQHLLDGGHAVLQLGTAEQVEELMAERAPTRVELVEVRRRERGVLAHLRTC
ncbi:methyltransferase [Nocardioides houyundeii]|uniref:methyltransferase n=1 Tax=Nocardioides houyundeii TaxID=2045452 RepID=UPI000C7754AB|nr:class I SAM-dependent methyltransferase [Nocardioides houyundeii]